jgi:AraC family transcriptional regulator, regulatory protein of adaptative response / methylated-DNA-[protein]-cysteine methyltransferase
MMQLPAIREMYDALVRKDPGFEGIFFACVRSTGIFCRPTCTARKPKPENVEFVRSIQEALHRGYRPCRVCKPLEAGDTEPRWLTDLINDILANPETRMRDEQLRRRGLEPALVRRTFKRRFGMTFHAYQRACRLGTALQALHRGAPTLDAGQDAGFESDSGFREAFLRTFGSAPGRARGSEVLTAQWIETPLGPMLAIATKDRLALLEFVDRRALETELTVMRQRLGSAIVPGRNDVLTATATQLAEYFAGTRHTFDLPLLQRGSPFDQRVWQVLTTIPYGETRSYRDVAHTIGSPAAVRAVGAANGRNQLAIIVPCHRVVGADGQLSGYAGGRWRKQFLLDHERQQVHHIGYRQPPMMAPMTISDTTQ